MKSVRFAKRCCLAGIFLLLTLAPAWAQLVITNQPQNQTNIAGTTVVFTVGATGTPPLSYQWRSYANQTTFTNIAWGTEDTLVLTNVQTTTRRFGVVVRDAGGLSATSRLAQLTVVGPSLQFNMSSYSVAESAGSVTLIVQRTDWLDLSVSVDYTTADGSATNGLKYSAVAGTLAFGAGETNKTIVVPILNDGFVESPKSFHVVLSNPTGGAVLGANRAARPQG